MSDVDHDRLLASYEFELPEHLIAQRPAAERDASRLLRMNRSSGELAHHGFRELPGFLKAGDVLVLNNTRVIPARLKGHRRTGGRVELLLLHAGPDVPAHLKRHAARWEALIKPSARIKPGEPIEISADLVAIPESRVGEHWLIRLEAERPVLEVVDEVGEIPLPPYIRRASGEGRDTADLERYQTVYAQQPGAAAAPTAGLHFSAGLLELLSRGGVEIHTLTLHVGAGTFSPVRSEDIAQHRMHSERYTISSHLWESVHQARTQGRRVIAVGTTSVRALESAAVGTNHLDEPLLTGETSIFIYPGFQFRVVDGMITNFHLPRSSLLMLVSAFAGRERVLEAYRVAVENGYRFFSYGDAMFIS